MRKSSSTSAFDVFVLNRHRDLQLIAKRIGTGLEIGDVVNQSWVLASELSSDDTLVELEDLGFQDRLLARLKNSFMTSAERVSRKSERLDSGNVNEDPPLDTHPLMRVLTSETPDPLAELLNQEEDRARKKVEISLNINCTLAGAYACLLEYFSNWKNLAEHLDISIPTARKRYHAAEFLARCQHSLRVPLPKGFMPGSGRARRLELPIKQLMFEFTYQLTLQIHTTAS